MIAIMFFFSNNLYHFIDSTTNFAQISGATFSFSNINDFSRIYEHQYFIADPQYVSDTDLHVQNIDAVYGKAIYDPMIMYDFDGQKRKHSYDIGADEVGKTLPKQITEDTTLSGIVFVEDTVTCSDSATLTIDPGTKLYFHDSAKLVIYGRIKAQGTKNSPILITGNNSMGGWNGIHINGNSLGQNIFRYCNFKNSNDTLLYLDSSDLLIENCSFINNFHRYGVLNLNNTKYTIKNTFFINNESNNNNNAGVINSNFTTFAQQPNYITNCIFVNNRGDAVDVFSLNKDSVFLEHNTFFYNSFSYNK